MQNAKIKPIVIQNPLGGMGYDLSASNNAAVQAKEDQYTTSDGVSLFRLGKVGHIAPGETYASLTDATPYVTSLLLNATMTSGGAAYAISDQPKLIQIDSSAGLDTVSLTRTVALSGSHSGHSSLTGTYSDVLSYKNGTNEYVLYSWSDGTDGDVGRMLKDGSSPSDNFLSTLATQTSGTALTAAVPHIMAIGADGIIYITNGQYIASHDPNTTTVNYQALNLGWGWIATTLSTYGNYLVIGGYKATTWISSWARSDAKVWFWNGYAPDPNFVYQANDNYVSALVNNQGILQVFTQGRSNSVKVKQFNQQFGRFDTIFESAKIGSAPRHGSVEVFEGKLHWAAAGGTQINVLDGTAFHVRNSPTDGSVFASDIGFVKNLSAGYLYLGVKAATTPTTYKIMRSATQTAGYQTPANFRSRLIELPYKSVVKKITILFSQFAASSSLLVSLFQDYNSVSPGGATDLLNWTITSTSEPTVITNMAAKRQKAIPDISSFYLNLRFNHSAITDTAAIVRAIVIEYEAADNP